MNKFGVAVAFVAVLAGLVAVNSVSGNLISKKVSEESSYEHETGELDKPRHHHSSPRHRGEGHDEAPHRRVEHSKDHKGPVRGRREHHHSGGNYGRKPDVRPLPSHHHHHHHHHRRHWPKKHHHTPRRVCSCVDGGRYFYDTGRGGSEGDRGGYEGGYNEYEHGRAGSEGPDNESGNDFGQGGDFSGEGGRDGSEFEGGDELGRGEESSGHGSVGGGHESGGDSGKRHGSFKGAGVFGGFKKDKEFDAGVRAGSKQSNRNSFQKSKAIVVGEQKAVNGGASSSDFNNVEGVHKHKNVNNDKLIVKETQRGNEDIDSFRGQSGHSEENHFGASDTKVLGAQAAESGASEQDSEKDFEADVHKKSSVGAVGGAGVIGGRF